MTTVLSGEDIRRLLGTTPPLLEEYLDLEAQLQPNGFDLTLREIAMPQTSGTIAADNRDRVISDLTPLVFDESGFINLAPGPYIVTFNEVVNLPNDLMALARPRSSLLRSGVAIHSAVWDAGYSGRSRALLVVYNQQGFRLQHNAGIAQMIFLPLTGETEGYSGNYLRENL